MPAIARALAITVAGLTTACADEPALDDDASPSSSTGDDEGSSDDGATDGTTDGAMDPPNEPPIARFDVAVHGTEVTLDASASTDPDGTIVAYVWTLGSDEAQGVDVTRSLEPGCHAVELTVTDDDGATATAMTTVVVAAGEPQLPPVVALAETPIASAVLPRDLATNEGTASFHGVVASNGFTELRAEVLEGAAIRSVHAIPLCSAAPIEFQLDVPIHAELTAFDIRLSIVGSEHVVEVASVADLVAGDLYLVNGQSNAAANPQSGVSNVNQGPFVRSFGSRTDDELASDDDRTWHLADGDGGAGPGSVGQWALRMGARLVEAHEIPIGILNGARGGMPIDFFQRNDAEPTDLATNYGRLLTRARNADLAASVRAMLWYQGEADGTDFQAHHDGFLALHADWAEDYPSLERVYVTQLRLGCDNNVIRTQEVQRQLADDFSEITVMSTNGIDGHDGCHYAYENGYRELGDRYAALLGRDLYGATPDADVQPPNPASARFASGGTQIVVTMRNAESELSCEDGAHADFRIHDGGDSIVTGCTAIGHELVLDIAGDASTATGINYLGHEGAGAWVKNESDLGLLSFWKVPIDPE
jgi:hypothetical protein